MTFKSCLIACLVVLCCLKIEATITSQNFNSSNAMHQRGSVKEDAKTSKFVLEQIERDIISGIDPQGDPKETNHCYAIVRTNDESSTYLGASGLMSLYNPNAQGRPQWSATRMRLQNGDNSIEAGWMVNEDLFKDNKTHLYVRFMVGGKGCFNVECPGFVQVSKNLSIGYVPHRVSKRGQYYCGWRISIDKRLDDGHWWLSFGNQKLGIGYWPKSLFTSLADHANQIDWGGEVYYSSSGRDAPEMGCGYHPTNDGNTGLSAFFALARVVGKDYRVNDPPTSTVKYSNCYLWYSVHDSGYQGPVWGRIILFGGPKI